MSKIVLIWGATGWIGKKVFTLLQADSRFYPIASQTRLQNTQDIRQEIKEIEPDFIINCAGIVGNPTVDWCQEHPDLTYQINTECNANLAKIASEQKIHYTYYGTGCIYTYDETHPIGTMFNEQDTPNFTTSIYSHSKVLAEQALSQYNNVLILRIRMPISDTLEPKSLITKLINYQNVHNIPNSVTVLSDILPVTINLMYDRCIGIYNCTNPGTITHPEILEYYKQYVNFNHSYNIFSIEEQNKILKTHRSNCYLDTSKLTSLYFVPDIKDSIRNILVSL